MPNLVKEMMVRDMIADFRETPGMLVVSFGGLEVSESEEMRGKVAEKGARLRVVRNNLARLALKEHGIEFDEESYAGNTAIAWGEVEAVIGAAKVFTEPEVKKTKKVKFKAGILDGQVLDSGGAAAVADLPDRDTLNAQLLGVLSGPARGLATVLNALPAATARVIQARADSLEGEDS